LYFIVLVGPAGSGKSYLADALGDWMEFNELSVARVNLDPAAEWIPYEPDVDVRSYVDARAVMRKYKLGPNGALVASVDMMVEYADKLREEIEAAGSNYVIIDTPGQMELFAFRDTGPYVVHEITRGHKTVTVFIVDSVFASNPRSLASTLLLALSTRLRMGLPQVTVVSKVDLLEPSRLDELEEQINNPSRLYAALIEGGVDPAMAEASARALEALYPEEESAPAPLRFVSALSGYGLEDLYAAIQQVVAGGEDYFTEEPSPRR